MAGIRTLLRRRERFVPPEGSYLLATAEQQYVGRPQELWLTPGLAKMSMLVLGGSGSGKTKLLELVARQFVERRQGFCEIDLHGDFSQELFAYLCEACEQGGYGLADRVVYVDFTDERRTVTFNPLASGGGQAQATQLLEVLAAFKRHWPDFWGPRLADCMLHTLAVLQANSLTLCEAPLVIGDVEVRRTLLAHPQVGQVTRDYFAYRYGALSRRDQVMVSESTSNKIGALLSDRRTRTFLGEPRGTLDPKRAIEQGQIVLCRIPKGELVEHAGLIGSLLVAAFQTSAMARAAIPPGKRTPYVLVLDEAGSIATDSFEQLLSAGRAFGLSAIASAQFLGQFAPPLREALLANCGVRACFRLSRRDAEQMAKELFVVDGDHAKHVDRDLLGSRQGRPTFFTAQEETEYACRELQFQHQRECVIALGRELPWFAETVTVTDAQPSADARRRVEAAMARHTKDRSAIEAAIAGRRHRLINPQTEKGASHDGQDDTVEMLA